MTEQEWLESVDPKPMLRFLGKKASLRKLRLFACACCRRVWPLLTDARSCQAVEVAERFAEGQTTDQERNAAWRAAADLDWQITREEGDSDSARELANCAATSAANDDDAFLPHDSDEKDFRAAEDSSYCAAVTREHEFTRETHSNTSLRRNAQKAARTQELAAQAALVRCMFGNPFRPITINPAWQTPTVTSLARAAYEERSLPSGELDPARLAVLADALEEAGCTNPDILDHLRGPGPHVRGCWLVDHLLGKE
jgi:hypothetical protein